MDRKNYLESAIFEFKRYKALGNNTFAQLQEEDLYWQYNDADNSIALIVKHMAGNMLSRWTNFLNEDGEKSWRNREEEFVNPPEAKEALLLLWEKDWDCLFDALSQIDDTNFEKKIHIRNEPHTIIEAINRQLAHYANHAGQIVLLGKMIRGEKWISLSVPKGGSKAFNDKMFGKSLK
ncbi:DUF1572 family protein [Maribacter sp. 2210JD10-5]|uniref:DUF1572 family protein n=1 Tax=Maribacter sp. 2210JD10-5 TaxID=3386272 RepID=UPI0039BD1F4F